MPIYKVVLTSFGEAVVKVEAANETEAENYALHNVDGSDWSDPMGDDVEVYKSVPWSEDDEKIYDGKQLMKAGKELAL